MRKSRLLLATLSMVLWAAYPSFADAILFDATKHEMAGNADWVIDADTWDLSMEVYPCGVFKTESNAQRIPFPPQSGVTSSTAETYWDGAVSAWAIELVKAGHTVETLPPGGSITFGDAGNPQDLSNYKLFIVVEPNAAFTPAEKAAILAFVNAGGGLFMVADHETSDRDCDGLDAPNIWNDLTGATSPSSTGTFGIWFRVDGLEVKGEDWFDDGTDNNVTTETDDPIIHGPFGEGTGGLGFFGATSMDIDPALATAHVWRTGQAHNELRVTFATAAYGAGRVAAIGDSSPADDGTTGDPNDTVYDGWDKAVGGVNNREIHLNACHWLLNPTPDTTAPVITAGPAAAAGDCSATVSWTTDESATSAVAFGTTTSYGSTASTAGRTKDHAVVLDGLTPSTVYHYQVSSTDASGNGPTQSADHTFTTAAAAAPSILSGPTVGPVSGMSATVAWTTSEPATSGVDYGLTTSYGSSASTAGLSTTHSVTLSGLAAETTYHYQVLSTDGCGNGPATSGDATFTTGPASLDISGWVLKQFNSTQTFTLPAGTTIPSGGYLVLGREATRAEFEAAYPSMPAAAVYLNSNATGSCADGCFPLINGAETFELWNGTTMEDGTTIAMASGNAYQRKNPGDPPGVAGSWTSVSAANSTPGQGAGTGSGAGVVINEMADASSWAYEFIELYYDAGATQADTTAPAAVTDLTALALGDSQIRLTWTAPGDDGSTGTATAYDLRRSSTPIADEAAFAAATAVAGVQTPSGAGSVEQFVVTGLSAGTTYHFALKTRDEVPNWSALSNSPSAATEASSDVTPPAPVVNLVATPLSDTQVRLTWSASGDDGTTGTLVGVGSYDLYWKTTPITSESDLAGVTPASHAPAQAPGNSEQATVSGLTADTPYYFVVRAKDEVPNASGLSNCAAATTGLAGSGSGADHLVISQFSVATTGSDVVEIYNPTSSAVSLSNHSLQNLSTGGNNGFQIVLNAAASVPAHGWYLVAGTGYSGTPSADQTWTNDTGHNFANTGGHIALVSQTGSIGTGACSHLAIVDKVGYAAAATCPEGGSGRNTAVPTAAQSVTRRPGGSLGNGQDTDVNSDDFSAPGTPGYHNASSTPATPPSSLGNVGDSLFVAKEGEGARLDWARAAAATAYNIYSGTVPNFMDAPPTPASSVANTYLDNQVPAPELYFVILATDGTNVSED